MTITERPAHVIRRQTEVRAARYGLTLDELDELLATQGNACGICGKKFSRKAILQSCALVIDHDHGRVKGGHMAVRGLLCSACNTGLGFFKDCTERLDAAIRYIKNPPAAVLHRGWCGKIICDELDMIDIDDALEAWIDD